MRKLVYDRLICPFYFVAVLARACVLSRKSHPNSLLNFWARKPFKLQLSVCQAQALAPLRLSPVLTSVLWYEQLAAIEIEHNIFVTLARDTAAAVCAAAVALDAQRVTVYSFPIRPRNY